VLVVQSLQAPREVIWLNGPPGAGKGANTNFIKRIRGMTRSITTSGLLETYLPAKKLMDAGELVSDEVVGDALLEAIFNKESNDGSGIIVDGFPRTALQVPHCHVFTRDTALLQCRTLS
jgi:adenylate kinase